MPKHKETYVKISAPGKFTVEKREGGEIEDPKIDQARQAAKKEFREAKAYLEQTDNQVRAAWEKSILSGGDAANDLDREMLEKRAKCHEIVIARNTLAQGRMKKREEENLRRMKNKRKQATP